MSQGELSSNFPAKFDSDRKKATLSLAAWHWLLTRESLYVRHEQQTLISLFLVVENKQGVIAAGGAPIKDATTNTTAAAEDGEPFIVKRMTTGLLTPERKIRQVPGYLRSWINIGKSSWLNILLVFIPISWALHFAVGDSNPTAVFCCCFVAVIPL